MRSSSALLGAVLLCGCGPSEISSEDLFETLEISVDPDHWVPFARPPSVLSTRVTLEQDQVTWEPASGSAADGFRVVGQRGARFLVLEEVKSPTPLGTKGYDRIGVQSLHGDFAGPIVWADVDGSGTGALSPPPDDPRVWATPGPLSLATGSTLIECALEVVLFGAVPPDLSGTGTLVLRMEADAAEIRLGLDGVIDEVRDSAGQPLNLSTDGVDQVIDLGSTQSMGSLVTLEIDWHIDDLTVEVAGRPVADATTTIAYVGDRRRWFPRPDETPPPGVQVTLVFDVPAGYDVFTAGLGPTRAPAAAGREKLTFLPGVPLAIWPIFVAGDYVTDSPTQAVTVGARAPLAGPPSEFGAFVQGSAAAYADLFGPMPGEHTSLVQVPVEFSFGFAGPQVALIPVSDWSTQPSSFARFLLAHELSHAWWAHGTFPGDPLDAWVIEGLADYSAARALRAVDGVAAEREQVDADLELLVRLMEDGFGGTPGRDVPVWPDRVADLQDYIYYLKGAWVLRHLESVVGTAVMDDGLAGYHASTLFQPGLTADFTAALEQAFGASLGWYWDQWLSGTGLPEITVEPFYRRDTDGAPEMRLSVEQQSPLGGTSPWQVPFRVELREGTEVLGVVSFCTAGASEFLAPSAGCSP